MMLFGFGQTMYDSDKNSVSSSDTDDSSDSDFSWGDVFLSFYRFFADNDYYWDDNEEFYSTGDAYLIPTKALRLEKVASVRIAIEVWNYAIGLLPEVRPDAVEWRRSLREQLMTKWIPQLPLPKSFARNIEDHFCDLLLNIKDWIAYHFGKVFWNRKNKTDLFGCLHCIVWHTNGSINYYETALNLLKSDKLGELEKYRLACTYCMKEEVKKRWQALDGNKELNCVAGFFDKHPLYYYWNYYYIDNLDTIPKSENLSLDEFMIRHTAVDNWPAIEYFFDRMNVDQQTASALYLIGNDHCEYQNLIIAKLNEFQRLNVYSSKGLRIIESYASFGGADINDPNAISAWYEVRDLIMPIQFLSLMNKLCIASAADAVLTEIWTSAYNEFKSYIFAHYHFNFIGYVLQWCYRKLENGYDFLIAVLAEKADPLQVPHFKRQELINEVCEKLKSDGEFELATRLLNFCIPDTEECLKFKEFWAEKNLLR